MELQSYLKQKDKNMPFIVDMWMMLKKQYIDHKLKS